MSIGAVRSRGKSLVLQPGLMPYTSQAPKLIQVGESSKGLLVSRNYAMVIRVPKSKSELTKISMNLPQSLQVLMRLQAEELNLMLETVPH